MGHIGLDRGEEHAHNLHKASDTCRHADKEQDINMYDLVNSKVQNSDSLLLDKKQGLPRTRGSISKVTKKKADHMSREKGTKGKEKKLHWKRHRRRAGRNKCLCNSTNM